MYERLRNAAGRLRNHPPPSHTHVPGIERGDPPRGGGGAAWGYPIRVNYKSDTVNRTPSASGPRICVQCIISVTASIGRIRKLIFALFRF